MMNRLSELFSLYYIVMQDVDALRVYDDYEDGAASGYEAAVDRYYGSPDDGRGGVPNSCCGILTSMHDWNSDTNCYNWTIHFQTNYAKVWKAPDENSKLVIAADLQQAITRPGEQSITKIAQFITKHELSCETGDDIVPQSTQIRTDIEFLTEHALQNKAHLAHTDFAQQARAFELVLGNALLTFEPLRQFLVGLVQRFVQRVQEVVPNSKPADYATVWPGDCFAGSTPNFNEDTSVEDLELWVKRANLRELLTKFYDAFGYSGSLNKWFTTDIGQSCLPQFRKRMVDPKGKTPRFRTPLTSIGMGWMELQQASFPSRGMLKGSRAHPWIETLQSIGTPFLFGRMDTIDPPLSPDEEAKLKLCSESDHAPAGRVGWTSGKYGFLVEDNSPLWLMGQITGLPLSAGVSGTTYNIFSAAELLGFDEHDLALLRLACLGWMIPYQDHTMLEVMMGAGRSFHGRSYPAWTTSDATPTLDDWKGIHKHLLSDDYDHNNISLTNLNNHISAYIQQFNTQHGTNVSWPGESSQVKWWEHDVFDYMLDDMNDVKSQATFVAYNFQPPELRACEAAMAAAPAADNDEAM